MYFFVTLAGPINTLSVASSISAIVMAFLFLLTVNRAASLSKFSKSAPEKPGVLFARLSRVTDLSITLFLACTARISFLACLSGKDTVTCLSNLPGLSNAGSRTSGLFVAAMMIIPSLAPKPSISVNN